MDGDGDGQLASHSRHPLREGSAKDGGQEGDGETKSDSRGAQPSPAPHDQLLLTGIAVEAGEEREAVSTSGNKVELLTEAPSLRKAK